MAETTPQNTANSTAETQTAGELQSLPEKSLTELNAISEAFLAGTTIPEEKTAEVVEKTEDEPVSEETETADETVETVPEEEAEAVEVEAESQAEVVNGPDWLETGLEKVADGAVPKWLLDRVRKLAKAEPAKNAQIKALQAELSTVKEVAEKVAPIVLAPTTSNPLAGVMTKEALDREINNAQSWEDWCELNPDGGLLNPKDEESFIDADAVKQHRIEAKRILREATKREAWIAEHSKTSDSIKKVAPSLFERTSAEGKEREAFLKRFPEVMKDPNYEQVIFDYIEGKKAREERATGVQTVKVKAKPTATTTPPAKAAAATAPAATKAPVKQATATPDIQSLRKASLNGNEAAANALAMAFME